LGGHWAEGRQGWWWLPQGELEWAATVEQWAYSPPRLQGH
jgi:hypothetical protein